MLMSSSARKVKLRVLVPRELHVTPRMICETRRVKRWSAAYAPTVATIKVTVASFTPIVVSVNVEVYELWEILMTRPMSELR